MSLTDKAEAERLIKQLPDDCTIEEIQYHLFVLEKLRNARRQIEDKKVLTQEQVEKRLERWVIR